MLEITSAHGHQKRNYFDELEITVFDNRDHECESVDLYFAH